MFVRLWSRRQVVQGDSLAPAGPCELGRDRERQDAQRQAEGLPREPWGEHRRLAGLDAADDRAFPHSNGRRGSITAAIHALLTATSIGPDVAGGQ
jgi:hypothetical protein